MECPKCGSLYSRVIKSEPRTIRIVRRSQAADAGGVKQLRFRRRECVHCKARWTTREEVLGGSLDTNGHQEAA